MESIKIVAFAVAAAVAYGIAHDQATAHLCVEYFTIAHTPVFATRSPFWLALGWGIIATWWVGLPLGVLLALAARLGARPKLALAALYPWVLSLLATMALCAAVAWVAGAVLAGQGVIALPPALAGGVIAADHQPACMADWFAHSASYAAGLLGGLVVAVGTWSRRAGLARAA
jgi:hypothetical protein